MANNVQRLARLGQSIWFDNIERRLIGSGGLDALIAEGLLGMTSNPTIFEKAIGGSADYDGALRRLVAAGASAEEICDALFLEDVGMAADRFRPVFEQAEGGDGFVSIEVSPLLAHDTERTLSEARRLWRTLDRPERDGEDPGHAGGLAGDRGGDRRRRQREHHAHVLDGALRGGGGGVPPRTRAAGRARASRSAASPRWRRSS